MADTAAALGAAGWPITFHDGEHGFHTTVEAETGTWPMAVRVIPEAAQIICYSFPDVTVPEDRRTGMAILTTRLNFGLALGCFELDLDQGEIRFRTGLDLEDTPVTDALLRPMVMSNLFTVEQYLPAITDVLAGRDVLESVAAASARWGGTDS